MKRFGVHNGTNISEFDKRKLIADLEELVAPVGKTGEAVGPLFCVGTSDVFHPVGEELLVLLQEEELAKNHVGLREIEKLGVW